MSNKKKAVIIGAGPGGLVAAMILAKKGFEVEVHEKRQVLGGRNSPHVLNGFTFDVGPTFVMLPEAFKQAFELSGKNINDYLNIKKLEVMYRLRFADRPDFIVYFDKAKLEKEIEDKFPGESKGYKKWYSAQERKFNKMYPCLQIPYLKPWSYLNPKLLRALPFMDVFNSVYGVLSKFFNDERLKISMAFQAKYLGMSPWNCPGPFSILSFMEHSQGIYHFAGGVHRLTEAMAKAATENGARINLSSPVSEILFDGKKATGVKMLDGAEISADVVIMNADFARGMKDLVKETKRSSWSNKKLDSSKYSCSTFMIYFGLKQKCNLDHHNVIFSKDYKKNIDEIERGILPQEPSYYIQNACVTDPSLAPEGKSTIYVLVPVPNNFSGIDWEAEKNNYRNLIVNKIKNNPELANIEELIEVEKIITPKDWAEQYNIFNGAVFNLAHTIDQMLYLRPHNEFEGVSGLYLVGGGTHPGSGLPTIIESAIITADLISKKYE